MKWVWNECEISVKFVQFECEMSVTWVWHKLIELGYFDLNLITFLAISAQPSFGKILPVFMLTIFLSLAQVNAFDTGICYYCSCEN